MFSISCQCADADCYSAAYQFIAFSVDFAGAFHPCLFARDQNQTISAYCIYSFFFVLAGQSILGSADYYCWLARFLPLYSGALATCGS